MEFLDSLNDKEAQSSFNPADVEKYKVMAILPYIITILFFLPFVMDKNSTYCKFHSNQQLAWFIVTVVLEIVAGILGTLIPILGAIAAGLINLAVLAVSVLLAVCAYQNKAIRLPVIGSMFEIF